jgi:hypothetical protein
LGSTSTWARPRGSIGALEGDVAVVVGGDVGVEIDPDG